MDLSAGGSLAFLGGPHPADSTGAGTARRFAAGVALPSRGATIATAAGAEERAPGQIPRENHVAELAASGLAESKVSTRTTLHMDINRVHVVNEVAVVAPLVALHTECGIARESHVHVDDRPTGRVLWGQTPS